MNLHKVEWLNMIVYDMMFCKIYINDFFIVFHSVDSSEIDSLFMNRSSNGKK